MPTAVIWGGPEIVVEKGNMINITCSINYSNEPPAYIFWYHQDEVRFLNFKMNIFTYTKSNLFIVGNKF